MCNNSNCIGIIEEGKEILIIHEQQTSFIQEVKLTEQRKERKEEEMKEIKSTMTRKRRGESRMEAVGERIRK